MAGKTGAKKKAETAAKTEKNTAEKKDRKPAQKVAGRTAEKEEKKAQKSIADIYFPGLDTSAFTDKDEEKEYYLRFVDMLCLIQVDINENHPEVAVDRVGSILSDVALMQALEPHKKTEYAEKSSVRRIFDMLLNKSDLGLKAGYELPLSALLLSGLLDPLEMLAILMAYSSSVNRKYERIYGVLQEEKTGIVRPTKGLCHDLARIFLGNDENDIALLMNGNSFLNSVLLTPWDNSRGDSEMSRPLWLRGSVLSILCPCDDDKKLSPEGLGRCAAVLDPVYSSEKLLRKTEYEELYQSYAGMRFNGGVIELCAPYGSGKRYLVRALAGMYVCNVLSVDIALLLTMDTSEQEQALADICVRGILAGDIVYLFDLPKDKEDSLLRIFSVLKDKLFVFIVGSEKPLGGMSARVLDKGIYRIELKDISDSAQLSLWQEAAEEYAVDLADDIDLKEIVSKFTMDPLRIFMTIKNCSSVADDFLIGRELLEEQIRRICAVEFGDSAKRLTSPFTWDDLIVEPAGEKLLKQVCDRVRFKNRVNDDFGFGEKLPYGRGISVVLYGPPGTGKTMAAQVLANTLGLDIYRIDLSQVSSKYIGETEKNLAVVFDAAKNSNAILFFDEADSLFSKRTDVSSSNDRYANAETSYLLQKVEEYSGMSILATNNLQNFDAAFKRRMSFMIPIGIPDEATRALLWKKAFPADAPLAKDVDFEILARAVEMSGSSIKSSAVSAAYLAAAAGKQIDMEMISQAVDRESLKNGRTGAGNDILRAMMEG